MVAIKLLGVRIGGEVKTDIFLVKSPLLTGPLGSHDVFCAVNMNPESPLPCQQKSPAKPDVSGPASGLAGGISDRRQRQIRQFGSSRIGLAD